MLELIQGNIPFEEIIERYYPDLEIEDIKACVVYATELVRSEQAPSNPTNFHPVKFLPRVVKWCNPI